MNKQHFRVAIIGKMLHQEDLDDYFAQQREQFHPLVCPCFEKPSDAIPWLVKLLSQDCKATVPLTVMAHAADGRHHIH